MSLFRSILQGRPLQRGDYDLPLYRTVHEAEAFPPAPISKSIYMSTPGSENRSPSVPRPRSDDLVILARRERHYHHKLQDLLDAQSDGLLAGLEGGSTQEDDEESLNTPTQTTYSLRSGSESPAPRERRKNRSLAAARRGIWKTVLDCAAVKEEEDYLLKQELKNNQATLQQLEAWSSKEHGLKEKITAIENEDSGAKAEALKEEAAKLEGEIQDMEVRLAQMKTRHRRLLSEISDVENSVSSKLSSYKTSLSLLEQDVQNFLKSPPTQSDRGADSPFPKLPPKRRTLEIAREHWHTEIEELKKQRRSARRDRVALEDGADVWRDVVADITEFEKYLKEGMGSFAAQQATSTTSKGKRPVSPSAGASPADMLDKMDTVARSVEESLDLAHKKQWRLLEVCIEAELRALQQGKEVLESIFGLAKEQADASASDSREDEESENEGPSTQDSSTKDLFASAAEGLGKSSGPMSHSAALRKSMYEDDDGPDPELLFTRLADDTE